MGFLENNEALGQGGGPGRRAGEGRRAVDACKGAVLNMRRDDRRGYSGMFSPVMKQPVVAVVPILS